jgi:hypothetical protein
MHRHNNRTIRDMTILGGWLFADLLLALMVIFMAAQPPIPKPIPPTPTPTFTPAATPTPTQEPRLDFNFQRITLSGVDYNGILNNTPSAVNSMEQAINNHAVLNNRSVGLVIVYDGAPSDPDIQEAQTIGQAVIDKVLKVMGRQGPLFQRASYYNPIYLLGADHGTVVLDIYLFKN